jgi:hypothetical protein
MGNLAVCTPIISHVCPSPLQPVGRDSCLARQLTRSGRHVIGPPESEPGGLLFSLSLFFSCLSLLSLLSLLALRLRLNCVESHLKVEGSSDETEKEAEAEADDEQQQETASM